MSFCRKVTIQKIQKEHNFKIQKEVFEGESNNVRKD